MTGNTKKISIFLIIGFASILLSACQSTTSSAVTPNNETQTTQGKSNSQTSTGAVVPDLKNIPIYPKAELRVKEYLPPCPDESMGICDVNMYTYKSNATFKNVTDWYEKDLNKSGWSLVGGGGDEGSRYGNYEAQDKSGKTIHLDINLREKGTRLYGDMFPGGCSSSEGCVIPATYVEITYKQSK